MATCPSIQLPALLFACVLFVLFLLFEVVSPVNQGRTKGEGWSTTNYFKPPSYFDCWPSQGGSSAFGSLVILDVARCCLCLFTLYINIKIGKNSC